MFERFGSTTKDLKRQILTERIQEVVGQALGEASMCWDPPPSSQVFDSTRAGQLQYRTVAQILAIIREEL